MRLAVLTVSPNRQYRGILLPTTPVTTGPDRQKLFTQTALAIRRRNDRRALNTNVPRRLPRYATDTNPSPIYTALFHQIMVALLTGKKQKEYKKK